MDQPVPKDSQAQDGVDGGRLNNGTECHVKVNAKTLGEATKNPTRLVLI